jgi:hypothetical protein
MSVANKGSGSTAQPTNTGFGGSVNATGYNETYGEGDIYGGGGGEDSKTALSNGSAAKALSTSPQSQSFISAAATALPSNPISNSNESSWLKNTAGYVGLGTKVAGLGKNILNIAGQGKSLAGQGLGMAGQVGSALLTAYSAYKIAKGDASKSDYVNLGSQVVPYASQVAAEIGTELGIGALKAGGSAISGATSAVAAPLAIVGAANIARQSLGNANVEWEDEKKSYANRFYDDPAIGLAANTAESILGSSNDVTKGVNKVGTQFAHYAGNPIGKAFNLDFKGAAQELGDAPETSLQSTGVDKETSEFFNVLLNAPGAVLSDSFDPTKNTGEKLASVATGGLSSIISNALGWSGGKTAGEERDEQARQYADSLQRFAQENPNYVFSASDVPFDFSNAYGRAFNDAEIDMTGDIDFYNTPSLYPSMEDMANTYKGKTPEEIQAMSRLSDADINKMLRAGKFTKYVSNMQTLRQQQAYRRAQDEGMNPLTMIRT